MRGGELLCRISPQRIADDLWTLVTIPSPTGAERTAALAFRDMLSACGARVEVDEHIPSSPSVIGRLEGVRPGPTIQLAGHIDHIDVPHEEPSRSGDTISARGAADMKNGLSGILSIVRALSESGCDFPGSVLVTVYGLHEAPRGHSEALLRLIERGVCGDAALVMEGPADRATVCGKGQSIWNLHLRRAGAVCHELSRDAEADHLIDAVLSFAGALRRHSLTLAGQEHRYPLLGPESVFVGQIHYGDFYNRVPGHATMQGTWRWHPDKSFGDVQLLLHSLLQGVPLGSGVEVEEQWSFVGESFSLDPHERIVRALQRAHQNLFGTGLDIGGISTILDTNRLVALAGVPTVNIGFQGEGEHGDREAVSISRLAGCTKLALLTALTYLEDSGGGTHP